MHPHSREELDNKWKIIQHVAFLSALTVITVTVRITSRVMQWRRLSVAEYLLLVSTAISLALNGCLVYAIDHAGLGHHTKYIAPKQMVSFVRVYFATILLIPTCFATAKLSLLWFLHRIFANSMFRIVVRVLVAVVVSWWAAVMVVTSITCRPANSTWEGSCTKRLHPRAYLVMPIPWIVSDWLILIAPLPVLWKSVDTRKSRATQIGLLILFGLGIVTCSISIKRYVELLRLDEEDPTFSFTQSALWSMIECTTTICCAALPGSTFALKRMLPVDLLKRTVYWVEKKFGASESSLVMCRNPRVIDADADAELPVRNEQQREEPRGHRPV